MTPFDLIKGYWKLTLPDAKASEIKPPKIITFDDPNFFHLNAANNGVIFKAPSLAGTTTNSNNTRSELRELNADGSLASWSTSVGVHSMECEFSVDVLPYPKKPHVVTGQIHDGSDDVTVFRAEGNVDGVTATIWITDGNTTHGRLLTDKYKIGDRYRVGFYISNGAISYTFNSKIIVGYTQVKKKTGCYFKAGCYSQDGGDTTKRADGENVYAQVTLYAVQVCHDGVCTGNAPGGSTGSPTGPAPEPVEGPPTTTPPPVVPPVIDFQPLIDALKSATPLLESVVAQIQAVIDKLSSLKNGGQ